MSDETGSLGPEPSRGRARMWSRYTPRWRRSISLILRNALFTIVVPGAGGVAGPWYTLVSSGGMQRPTAWSALGPMALGVLIYLWAVGTFAAIGRGTPGYWDSPRTFVAVGPYRWVRNPIYIAALLIVGGEAWLFMSLPLLKYAIGMAVVFEVFVIGYEEPHLRRRFGSAYVAYGRRVRRWLPLPPHTPTALG
jgi:protein-S-isoprenylcysteine O-methyltransferase Ste14